MAVSVVMRKPTGHAVNVRTERALRDAMGHVAHAEADQIESAIAALEDAERAEALALAVMVACYVAVDACGAEWPDDANIRQFAHGLATVGTTAERLHLNENEIYAYLSRTVFGPEPLENVIPEEPELTRVPVIVAQRATVVYRPKDKHWWEYLDQVESAIEIASALDATVLPAAVMRAYLPKPPPEG
jgi:hypothetical protein